MKLFHIHELSDSSVLALSDIRPKVKIDPEYQRPGGVWSLKKKQLFIDSLLNGYDIPKLYFHVLTGKFINSDGMDYAIIDGRQRLEAIWDFIDGRFALSDDFRFFENEDFAAAGLTFSAIEKQYPRLLIRFHARSLSVIVVTTEDLDFIEDMFSRLNEAVPLNAAEKRNAFGGPLPLVIKDLAAHKFFVEKVSFSSTRYRHYDVAAKILIQEQSATIVDTKKARLDAWVKENRKQPRSSFDGHLERAKSVLDQMCTTFADQDALLRSTSLAVVYYLLFAQANIEIRRSSLVKFDELRALNRKAFEDEQPNVNFRWIEYDELAQSANDAAAIKERVSTLLAFLESDEA